MAITYIETPQLWSPVNNDLIYYVSTNTGGLTNVYLSVYTTDGATENLVAKTKLSLDANGRAWCNIRPFLQSFTKNNQLDFTSAFQTELGNYGFYVNYIVKVEETLGGGFTADTARYAFNGQMSFTDFVEFNQNMYRTFNVNSKFLTNSPRVLNTDWNRTNFLTYIKGSSTLNNVRLIAYNGGGTTTQDVTINSVAGIIAFRSNILAGSLPDWSTINTQWQNINVFWNAIVDENTEKLEVQLGYKSGGSFTPLSEIFTYLKYDYCSKYEKTNVYWQNSLGGWDSYTFNMVKKKRYNIERKQISTNPYIYGASGYSQHTNNVFNAGNQDYFTNYTEGYVLNSDLLTNDEHTWMWELIKSHNVYVEQLINGVTYYVPSVIKNTNYEPKITKVDGISNISLEVEFGYDNIRITR
jgi:hypothetical protein